MYDKHLRRVVSESYKWKNLLKLWIYENHICELRVIRNFCSWEKKAWKQKFRLVWDSNPCLLRCRCSALPVKLTSQLAVSRWLNWFVINPWKDNDEVMNTAISRKVVGKNMNATIPKGNSGALARAKRARSGAPWVTKFGKLSIRENLVMTWRTPARPSVPTFHVSRCEMSQ